MSGVHTVVPHNLKASVNRSSLKDARKQVVRKKLCVTVSQHDVFLVGD